MINIDGVQYYCNVGCSFLFHDLSFLGAARLPSLAVKCNCITVVGILEFSFGLLTLSNVCVVQANPGRNEVYIVSDTCLLL